MNRVRVVVTVAIMMLAPFVALPALADEENWVDEAWDGVSIAVDTAPLAKLDEFLGTSGKLREQITTGHVVTLTNSAEPPSPDKVLSHVPEVPGAEFMAIYVQEGEFVLDVMPPTSFIVDPAGGREITVLEITGDELEAYYSLPANTDTVLRDAADTPCTELCTLPEPSADPLLNTPPERTAVQLLPGDWILSPAGGLCVWCLMNTWDHAGTTGVLYVYPLSEEPFSWMAARDAFNALEATPQARLLDPSLTDAVTTGALTNAASWAFFSPAPNCRTG